MSEILEAIKVWEQQNSPTIKGLDVAKQNAISQALNFFNKKFGGEGELMPIIEEKLIVETPITTLPPKVESVKNFIVGEKVRLIKDIDKKSYPNNQELEIGDIGIVRNKEGFSDQYDVEFNGKEIYLDSSFFELVEEKSKVEKAINEQIMIPQMTQFELMSDVGSKLKKGDTGVFAEDYIPPNTFLDAYMNSEARPDVIYKIPFKKIRIIEEAPIEEIKQAEEEVLFTDLEELENEIESINFEELENLDKELDDLF